MKIFYLIIGVIVTFGVFVIVWNEFHPTKAPEAKLVTDKILTPVQKVFVEKVDFYTKSDSVVFDFKLNQSSLADSISGEFWLEIKVSGEILKFYTSHGKYSVSGNHLYLRESKKGMSDYLENENELDSIKYLLLKKNHPDLAELMLEEVKVNEKRAGVVDFPDWDTVNVKEFSSLHLRLFENGNIYFWKRSEDSTYCNTNYIRLGFSQPANYYDPRPDTVYKFNSGEASLDELKNFAEFLVSDYVR